MGSLHHTITYEFQNYALQCSNFQQHKTEKIDPEARASHQHIESSITSTTLILYYTNKSYYVGDLHTHTATDLLQCRRTTYNAAKVPTTALLLVAPSSPSW